MTRYSAQYKCSKCGAVETVTATASDYHNVLTKLPRWRWPNSHKMRRILGPTVERKDN